MYVLVTLVCFLSPAGEGCIAEAIKVRFLSEVSCKSRYSDAIAREYRLAKSAGIKITSVDVMCRSMRSATG